MLTSDDKPQRTQSFRTKRFLRLLLREAIDMPGTRLIESLPLLLRSISHRPEPPKIPFFTYSVFSVPSVVKKPDPPMLAVRTSLRPGFRKLLTDSAEVAQKLRFVTGQA